MPRSDHVEPRIWAVAEAIAKKAWEIKVEDEQSKTEFDINAPDFDDLGSHRDYLISEAVPLARAALKVADGVAA